MKKSMKKLIALVLSLILAVSVAVVPVSANLDAPFEAYESSFELIIDFFKRILALFGSTNEASNVSIVSMETGEVVSRKDKTDTTHASTITKLNNGDLMSAWFGGSGEGDADVRIWFSVYSDGKWSEAKQIPSEDTVAHWNPVLENFGLFTRLYYKVGEDTENWVTKYVDTYNNGKTWTSAKELVEGDTSGGRGPVRSKLLTTSKGVIIAPASTEQGEWKAFFDISKDGGKTWTKTAFVESDTEMIQPTLWEDLDGGIHAFFRTKAGKIYRSDSTDGGYTWCEAYPINLPNNNSGIDVVMSDNGWLWLAYNPIAISGMRNTLMLSVSKDGGETWKDVEVLADNIIPFNEYSYPSMIIDGNTLYITFTYERQRIDYAIIEFAD